MIAKSNTYSPFSFSLSPYKGNRKIQYLSPTVICNKHKFYLETHLSKLYIHHTLTNPHTNKHTYKYKMVLCVSQKGNCFITNGFVKLFLLLCWRMKEKKKEKHLIEALILTNIVLWKSREFFCPFPKLYIYSNMHLIWNYIFYKHCYYGWPL